MLLSKINIDSISINKFIKPVAVNDIYLAICFPFPTKPPADDRILSLGNQLSSANRDSLCVPLPDG